jgi:hypothetical protein
LHQTEWVSVLVPVKSKELYLIEIEQRVECCIEIVTKGDKDNHVLRQIGASFLVHHKIMKPCFFKCLEEKHGFDCDEQDTEKSKY